MQSASEFKNSLAVVIGIDSYHNGMPPLRTAVNDARRLAQILQDEHGYAVTLLLNEQASAAAINDLLNQHLPSLLTSADRLLFYFAGHGTALDSDDGPRGYLIPQDADAKNPASFLRMHEVHEALNNLTCRHLLVILDSCFSGAFRWSATRDFISKAPTLYKERYDRFIRDPAWQVITSASFDQKASDKAFNDDRGQIGDHSPFAHALFEALETDVADRFGDTKGADGVLTAEELFLYLEQEVQPASEDAGRRQTPERWTLEKHNKGQFIFHVGDVNLTPAPRLDAASNPYRGLKPYEKEHAKFFFGRDEEIKTLFSYVEGHPLTVVLGASGTGKSSVVKAGLVNRLISDVTGRWEVLPVIRPAAAPLSALSRALEEAVPGKQEASLPEQIKAQLDTWCAQNPGKHLVLVIDQFEELVTMTLKAEERVAFLELLASLIENCSAYVRIIITLRTDFEHQFTETALKDYWKKARYVMPAMTREGLREVAEAPASAVEVYFEPYELVEKLVDEVVATPGGLPLLSFTLSEMYVRLHHRFMADTIVARSMTMDDYLALGGVIGSLRQRADEEYKALDEQEKESMRRAMLRMVSFGGGDVARQRLRKSEMDYPDPEETQRVARVIDKLTEARLLVTGQDEDDESYVEPAHDALVRAWDRLLGWIHDQDFDEQQERRDADLRFQRELARASREWALKKQQDGNAWWPAIRRSMTLFWKGDRVSTLNKVKFANWLNTTERRFARRCIQWWFATRVLIALALILIVGFGGLAQINAIKAENRAQIALSRQLAAQGFRLKDSQIDLALLLGVQSKLINETSESNITLGKILQSYPNLTRIEYPRDDVNSIAFSLDGKTLALGSSDSTIQLWDIQSNSKTNTLKGHKGSVNSVVFSPDSTTLISASDDSTIRVWNIDGDSIRTLEGHTGSVTSVAFSPGTKTLFSHSGIDKTIRLWNINTGENEGSIKEDKSWVTSVAFSPDEDTVASASEDKRIYLYNIKKNTTIMPPFEGHYGELTSLAFSQDGDTLVSASGDKTIRLWDTQTRKNIKTIKGHYDEVTSVALSRDGKTMASASRDKTIRLWDIQHGENTRTLDGLDTGASSVAFSPDGKTLAYVASMDSTIWLWDTSKKTSMSLEGHFVGVTNVDFSPDGKTLALASEDSLRLWDIEGNNTVWAKNVPSEKVSSATFSPDGKSLASASNANIMLWDIQTGEIVDTLKGHQNKVNSVTFSPDSKTLATASSMDNTIWLWDISRKTSRSIDGHYFGVTSIDFSPDGNTLAWASADSLRLWSIHDKKTIWANDVYSEKASNVSFSPDGASLASASEANIMLWDIQTGEIIDTLKGHQNRITSVSFSPNSTTLASASSLDGTIWLWDLNWTNRACQIANRNLTKKEWAQYVGAEIPYECTCKGRPAGTGAPPDAPGCQAP